MLWVLELTIDVQMSRRMGYSVVGLPHYTIWHLYEPSVDDIKHMEVSSLLQSACVTNHADIIQEMEQERLAREEEEKEKAEKAQKIKEQFSDPNSQWEKDKTEIQNIAIKDKAEKASKEKVKDTTGSSPKQAGAAAEKPAEKPAEKKPAAKKERIGGGAAKVEET